MAQAADRLLAFLEASVQSAKAQLITAQGEHCDKHMKHTAASAAAIITVKEKDI